MSKNMPHEQDQIIGSTPIPMAGHIDNQSSESTESEWLLYINTESYLFNK